MLGLRLSPDVPGFVAAVAVEGARRLAALPTEEGGVQFPAALRAVGEADSRHGPSLLRHFGKRPRKARSNNGPPYPYRVPPSLERSNSRAACSSGNRRPTPDGRGVGRKARPYLLGTIPPVLMGAACPRPGLDSGPVDP